MTFLLPCPSCGPREALEFSYGGEVREAPAAGDAQALARYLYVRENRAGPQREWWYHRDGCRRWFVATRDTRTNEVLETGWFRREA
jgi:sarcosine oxidase subunit delta